MCSTDDEFLQYVQSKFVLVCVYVLPLTAGHSYIPVASDDQIQALGEAYPSDPSDVRGHSILRVSCSLTNCRAHRMILGFCGP